MGLDGVEFLMDIEDVFGISINDEEAEQCRTIGDITSLISMKLGVGRRAPCVTRRRFRSVRRSIESWTGHPTRFRPSSSIESILPVDELRPVWRHMAASGIAPPPLVLSRQVIAACVAGPGLIGLAVAIGVLSFGGGIAGHGMFAGIIGGSVFILLLILAVNIARPFASCLAPGVETFGDLTRLARVKGEYDELVQWDCPDVYRIVRDIAAAQFGVSVHQINADTSFGDDLDV